MKPSSSLITIYTDLLGVYISMNGHWMPMLLHFEAAKHFQQVRDTGCLRVSVYIFLQSLGHLTSVVYSTAGTMSHPYWANGWCPPLDCCLRYFSCRNDIILQQINQRFFRDSPSASFKKTRCQFQCAQRQERSLLFHHFPADIPRPPAIFGAAFWGWTPKGQVCKMCFLKVFKDEKHVMKLCCISPLSAKKKTATKISPKVFVKHQVAEFLSWPEAGHWATPSWPPVPPPAPRRRCSGCLAHPSWRAKPWCWPKRSKTVPAGSECWGSWCSKKALILKLENDGNRSWNK